MLNSKLKRISLALVLAVALTLSLFTLSAFALEDAGAAPDGEQGIVLDVSAPAESDTAAADTEKVEAPESDSETAVDTKNFHSIMIDCCFANSSDGGTYTRTIAARSQDSYFHGSYYLVFRNYFCRKDKKKL